MSKRRRVVVEGSCSHFFISGTFHFAYHPPQPTGSLGSLKNIHAICFLSRAAKGIALMSSPMSTQSKTRQQNRNVDEDNQAIKTSRAHQGCSSDQLTALWQGIQESSATWKILHGTQPESQDK